MRACQECKTHVRRRKRAFSGRLLCPDCWFAAEVYARDDRDVAESFMQGPELDLQSITAPPMPHVLGPVTFDDGMVSGYLTAKLTAPPRFRAALRWNCDVTVYSA